MARMASASITSISVNPSLLRRAKDQGPRTNASPPFPPGGGKGGMLWSLALGPWALVVGVFKDLLRLQTPFVERHRPGESVHLHGDLAVLLVLHVHDEVRRRPERRHPQPRAAGVDLVLGALDDVD